MSNTKRNGLALALTLAWSVSSIGAQSRASAERPASPSSAQERSFGPETTWGDVEFEFQGNVVFKTEQLKRAIQDIIERYCEGGYSPPEKCDARFNSDQLDYWLRVNIVGLMRESGYLRAKVEEIGLQSAGRQLTVTVPIEEGELFRLGEVKIEGTKFFTAERLRGLLPLKRGDIADGAVLTQWWSEHLDRLYEERGFIQWQYDVYPDFKANPDGNGTADFNVTIHEGPRFVLRRIEFEGGSAPDYMLRDAMLIREGDYFNARKYRDGVRRLNDLDLFENVDADRDATFVADEEEAELFIKIRLKEKPLLLRALSDSADFGR